MSENITNEVLIEELQKRFSEYQNTLKELIKVNKDLKDVNVKLAESEKLKTHFLSNIANEIINPFTAIIGLSQNIIDAGPEDFDAIKKMSSYIYNEASFLDFQLKNIFAAAEIEAGESEPMFSKINIIETIKTIKDRYEYAAKDKSIEIIFCNKIEQNEYLVVSDHEKISLIISNLLNNAIKYCKLNKSVEICIYIENNIVNISVKDKGEGISEEKKQQIFDRFNRTKNIINSEERGAGLGLSISLYFAELIEAEIIFSTTSGVGSKFILKLNQGNLDIESFSGDDNQIFFEDIETF